MAQPGDTQRPRSSRARPRSSEKSACDPAQDSVGIEARPLLPTGPATEAQRSRPVGPFCVLLALRQPCALLSLFTYVLKDPVALHFTSNELEKQWARKTRPTVRGESPPRQGFFARAKRAGAQSSRPHENMASKAPHSKLPVLAQDRHQSPLQVRWRAKR